MQGKMYLMSALFWHLLSAFILTVVLLGIWPRPLGVTHLKLSSIEETPGHETEPRQRDKQATASSSLA